MYFAHFTVSSVSAPLLCDSVFASCCGKHNTAMIAHAFQRALNTAEEPKHSPSQFHPPLPLPPSALSLTSSSQDIQLPWLQTCIMTASPGGQRRYPTDAERLYPVVTLQEICRQCLVSFGKAPPEAGLAGFFVNKMKCKLRRSHWNSSLLPPITRPGRAPWKHKREYIIK